MVEKQDKKAVDDIMKIVEEEERKKKIEALSPRK
jgi:hypothetical protein